jgi:UDP-N-acetylglucosamine 4,6-dehydratase
MTIADLAKAIAPECPTFEIGIRPGEKLHEEMIATEDSYRAFELKDRYIVLPTVGTGAVLPPENCRPVSPGFTYRSDTNDVWLSADELRMILEPTEVPAR